MSPHRWGGNGEVAARFAHDAKAAADVLLELRGSYQAAKPNRYRRRRSGIAAMGSGADYHTRNDADFWRMVEYARDMDRNDCLIGQMIDRAVTNILQDGISYDPATGDTDLDKDLAARSVGWCCDPAECDAAGELCFSEMAELAVRSKFVDGDIVGLGLESGQIQLVESHLIRTPRDNRKGVVLGVQLGAQRRRVAYWVAPDNVDPSGPLLDVASGMRRYPTFGAGGIRQVFHLYSPRRATQTRGITALAPCFDLAGMFEDINFTNLVRAQVAACYVIFRKRELDFAGGGPAQQGARYDEQQGDGSVRKIEDLAPGMVLTGQPGEELVGFSPNVPNVEFFEHAKLLVTLIGINLGMPLVLALLDARETNFSGWRGAVDQARVGFRRIQRDCVNRFHAPICRWKIANWMTQDPALARAAKRKGIDIYGCRWNPPTWTYIEPYKDAQADALRLRENLTSPRRLHAENGGDWQDVCAEIVDDRTALIARAIAAADAINKANPEAEVGWRELAGMQPPPTKTGDAAIDEPKNPTEAD